MDKVSAGELDVTASLPINTSLADTGSGTEPIRLPYLRGNPTQSLPYVEQADTTGNSLGPPHTTRFNTLMRSAVIAASGALALTAVLSASIALYDNFIAPEAVTAPVTPAAPQTTTTTAPAPKSPLTVPFYTEAIPPAPTTTTPTTLAPTTTTLQARPPIELPVIDVQKIQDEVAAAIEKARQSIVTLPTPTTSTVISTSTTLANSPSTTTSSPVRTR